MRLAACMIWLTLTSGFAKSQSFDSLDHHQNFYGFEFGTGAEAFDNDLKLDLTISYGTKYYKYIGQRL